MENIRALTFGELFGEVLRRKKISEKRLPIAPSFLDRVKENRSHLPGRFFSEIMVELKLPDEIQEFLNKLWREPVEEKVFLPNYVEEWLMNGKEGGKLSEKTDLIIKDGLEEIIISATTISKIFMRLLQEKGLDKRGPTIKKEINRVFFQTIQQIAFTLKMKKEEGKRFINEAIERGIL